jgi:hypothetical protein
MARGSRGLRRKLAVLRRQIAEEQARWDGLVALRQISGNKRRRLCQIVVPGGGAGSTTSVWNDPNLDFSISVTTFRDKIIVVDVWEEDS